jgi:ABC-type Fe3+-siderophore transport system permease subunit
MSFACSALLAFGVNFATFLCTQVNSALTTSVTGQCKNIVTTILAIIIFGMHPTMLLLAGLMIGLIGSALYSYLKYDEQQVRSDNNNNGSSSSTSIGGGSQQDEDAADIVELAPHNAGGGGGSDHNNAE